MRLTRKLAKKDTVVEIRDTDERGWVEMRYVSPHESGWITEHYELATLFAVGWVPVDEEGTNQE